VVACEPVAAAVTAESTQISGGPGFPGRVFTTDQPTATNPGSALMEQEPVSSLGVRPFGEDCERFRARNHRAHDSQQQIKEGVTNTAFLPDRELS